MLEEQKKCFKNKRNKALFIKVRFQYKKGSEQTLWNVLSTRYYSNKSGVLKVNMKKKFIKKCDRYF